MKGDWVIRGSKNFKKGWKEEARLRFSADLRIVTAVSTSDSPDLLIFIGRGQDIFGLALDQRRDIFVIAPRTNDPIFPRMD